MPSSFAKNWETQKTHQNHPLKALKIRYYFPKPKKTLPKTPGCARCLWWNELLLVEPPVVRRVYLRHLLRGREWKVHPKHRAIHLSLAPFSAGRFVSGCRSPGEKKQQGGQFFSKNDRNTVVIFLLKMTSYCGFPLFQSLPYLIWILGPLRLKDFASRFSPRPHGELVVFAAHSECWSLTIWAWKQIGSPSDHPKTSVSTREKSEMNERVGCFLESDSAIGKSHVAKALVAGNRMSTTKCV